MLSSLRLPELSSRQQELLRWLAIACMVIDHVGAIFLDRADAQPLRAIGRVAWPLFAYLLAYNVARRRVPPAKYLPTLATFTLVSQLPHYLAFSSSWVSIIGTLLLGTTALHVLESRMHTQVSGLLLLSLTLLLSPFVEYGTAGVLLIISLWWLLRYPQLLALLTTAFLLAAINWPHANWPFGFLSIAAVVLVSMLPDRFGLPRSGRLPWLFYPGHLLLLAGIAWFIQG